MNITHSFGKRSIQMDEKIVMTRRDLERIKAEAIEEFSKNILHMVEDFRSHHDPDDLYKAIQEEIRSKLTKGKV